MYEDVVQLIVRARVPFPPFGSGVSQATIGEAEVSLGFPLPQSYKWWLLNYGGGQIRGDILYGLDEENLGRPDVVELAKMNERDGLYGRSRLVFCMGNAENFAFDTRNLDGDGEYEVLLHDIACGDEVSYARSFTEFLKRRIKELYGS